MSSAPDDPALLDDLAAAEHGPRQPGGMQGGLIAILAGGWSLFQLALPMPMVPLLDSVVVRCVHLAFALALVFLCYPAARRRGPLRKLATRRGFGFLGQRSHIPVADLVLAGLGALAALYLALDYEGLAERMGMPITRDLLVGIVLVVILLEAARRSLGPALPAIAALFILYSFVSEYMPSLIAFRNASLSKMVSKLALTTEGIYGVPLEVSASVVFLFVLFGAMLEKAGGGKYFTDLAFSLLGRFRGGPAKAAVLASGLTGMVNGSSIANTVTTGTFTIPLMKRTGFPAVKAGAVEVAASTNGQLMPPIMGAAAFIIAEYCNMSYVEVVRAAFVPAILSYLTLIWITHLEAGKLGLSRLSPEETPRFREVFPRGLHFLIPLVFLIYQLVIKQRSAALSAGYAILALAGLMVVQHMVAAVRRGASPLAGLAPAARDLGASLVAGGRNMMSIGVAVAAAGIIVGIVTLGLGQVVTEIIDLLSFGWLPLMLVLTALISLLLGMGLPTTANYIVMASLTAPAILLLADQSGYAMPLIAAHLFVFYFGILSDDTPPVGLSAYAAAAISGADPIRTGIQGFTYDIRTALLPFMFVFNTDLLLIGVHGPWRIGAVFLTGLAAMFAFAAMTQGFLLRKNRWYEGLLLACISLILLRPDFFSTLLHLPRGGVQVAGLLALFAVAAGQWKQRVR